MPQNFTAPVSGEPSGIRGQAASGSLLDSQLRIITMCVLIRLIAWARIRGSESWRFAHCWRMICLASSTMGSGSRGSDDVPFFSCSERWLRDHPHPGKEIAFRLSDTTKGRIVLFIAMRFCRCAIEWEVMPPFGHRTPRGRPSSRPAVHRAPAWLGGSGPRDSPW